MSSSLKADTTLRELQLYIKHKITERGFDKETTQQKFALLVEEVGELAKALRKRNGIKIADDSDGFEVKDEVADVLWSLIAVCNTLDIDLLDALKQKDEKNSRRTWR